MVHTVDHRQVAYIQTVDKREVHLRIADVKVALQVAGVFHGKVDFLLCQIVLAEYVETVFVEVSIEA